MAGEMRPISQRFGEQESPAEKISFIDGVSAC